MEYVSFDSTQYQFSWRGGHLLLVKGKPAIIEFLTYTMRSSYEEHHDNDIAVLQSDIDTKVREFFSSFEENFSYKKSEIVKLNRSDFLMNFYVKDESNGNIEAISLP